MGKAFESIKQGLDEAIAHAKGRTVAARVHEAGPVDVAKLRHRLGLTQEQFAARFGFSVATLRHWERGDRTPPRPGPRVPQRHRPRPAGRHEGIGNGRLKMGFHIPI